MLVLLLSLAVVVARGAVDAGRVKLSRDFVEVGDDGRLLTALERADH